MLLGDLLPSGVRIPVALFLGNTAFSFVVRTSSGSGVIKILSSASVVGMMIFSDDIICVVGLLSLIEKSMFFWAVVPFLLLFVFVT